MPVFFFYKYYSERELKMNIKLQPQVAQTKDGLYAVTYARLSAPLNVQEAVFAAHGIHIVSSAELGYLRAGIDDSPFTLHSRTGTGVFYDDRNGNAVIVPDEAISKQVGIANLVYAHAEDTECVVPKDQRELVYAMVDEMLKNGRAFATEAFATEQEIHRIDTSRFGEDGLTGIMFSNHSLGIRAENYGAWLRGAQGINIQSVFFDIPTFRQLRREPYLNRLSVYGPDDGFVVYGCGRNLGDDYGAFGARFEKIAEGGAKK